MGSTEVNIGFNEGSKVSSRVLKPPGGGHSNIFSPPEVKSNPPRPKYNQQNSSNLNAVMGTADPNLKSNDNLTSAQCDAKSNAAHMQASSFSTNYEESNQQQQQQQQHQQHMHQSSGEAQTNNHHGNGGDSANNAQGAGGRVRVPPGGFSSGLW